MRFEAGYGVMVVLAIVYSLLTWGRASRHDGRLLAVYLGGISGGLIGAKLLYLLAEGNANSSLREVLVGKSVLGGILGGYVSVELMKRFVGYRSTTGDLFATVVPFSIAIGRIGCVMAGCCSGRLCELGIFASIAGLSQLRWPAPWVELFFNVAMGMLFISWRRRGILAGQHFHVYMAVYGLFRFFHEFLRQQDWSVMPSVYQYAALFVSLAGILLFVARSSASKRGEQLGVLSES